MPEPDITCPICGGPLEETKAMINLYRDDGENELIKKFIIEMMKCPLEIKKVRE